MKKNILLKLLLLLFFITADAQAQWGDDNFFYYEDSCLDDNANFYAKIFSGGNFLQSTSIQGNKAKFQTGYIVAGSLGYNWQKGLLLEVEYAFRRNDIKKIHFFGEGFSKHGHFQTYSGMANLFWHLPLSSWGCEFWNMRPFIGVGIGYDFQQMRSSNSQIIFKQNWNYVSWQIMAGLSYHIFCNSEMTFEYKFHQGNRHFYNHSIGVGFVCKMGNLIF
jgi:opacity protein-like surface antigen